MVSADYTIVAMYVLAYLFTGYYAFAVLITATVASVLIASFFLNSFPSEYVYFLSQSIVWLMPAYLMRKSLRLALCAMTMCIYEWLVSIESFVWQYITPVETPLHSEYAFIIIGIHLFILSTTAQWGSEIGYTTRYRTYRGLVFRNL